MKSSNNAVPTMRQWVFADAAENEIFRMDQDSVPASQVEKIVELAGKRIRND